MNDLEFNFSEIISMIETRRNNAYKKEYLCIGTLENI